MIILFLWGLGSFVFYKVALDAAFDYDATVIACILLGVMVVISVFTSSYFYAAKMGTHLAKVRFGERSSYLESTLFVWVVTALLNIVLGKALIFGFAKSLNREFGGELLLDRSRYLDDFLIFSAVIVAPITFHFLSVLFGVTAKAKILRTNPEA